MTIEKHPTSKEGIGLLENKITLYNGTVLECYPKKAQPENIEQTDIQLDTTGEYLSASKGHAAEEARSAREKQEEEEKFFVDNAFLFFRNADRILKDSRMFLAPVPVVSGLAYTGTSGFHAPTLGVYIEWWLYSEAQNTKDKNGKDALTWHIAGSPLSGGNHCSCVYPDGKVKTITHGSFRLLWRSFIEINSRYTEAKQKYESYSLEEVKEILTAAEQDETSMLSTKLLIQERKFLNLQKMHSRLKDAHEKLKQKLQEVCIRLHQKELDDFVEEYRSRKLETEQKIEALRQRRIELKAQLKRNCIDNIEHQKRVHPIVKEQENLQSAFNCFTEERIKSITKEGDITEDMVMSYLWSRLKQLKQS